MAMPHHMAVAFCMLAAAMSDALKPPMPGSTDAAGPLPEGDSGYFCKTHDGAKRLFRRRDFYFCGIDAHLPRHVTYAVIGDAPAGLAAALKRFRDALAERSGVAIEVASGRTCCSSPHP